MTYNNLTNIYTKLVKSINDINTNAGGIPIELPNGTYGTAKDNTAIINKTLIALDPLLKGYIWFINYSGNITLDKTTTIDIHLKVFDQQTSINMNVHSKTSDQQYLAILLNKIVNKTPIISGTLFNSGGARAKIDTSNPKDSALIKKSIKAVNPLLTSSDLDKLTFSGNLWYDYSRYTLNVKVTIGSASKTIEFKPKVLNKIYNHMDMGWATSYYAEGRYYFTKESWDNFIQFYLSRGKKITEANVSYIIGDFWQYTSGGSFNGDGTGYNEFIRDDSDSNVKKYVHSDINGFPYGLNERFMNDHHLVIEEVVIRKLQMLFLKLMLIVQLLIPLVTDLLILWNIHSHIQIMIKYMFTCLLHMIVIRFQVQRMVMI